MGQGATATSVSKKGHEGHFLLQMARLRDVPETGPTVIVKGEGIRVWDREGKEYIDGLSGLLNVNIGYGNEELVETAAETMRRLSYACSFFGRTNDEALALADKLAEITPDGIDRFFLTAEGSDANDIAVKLVRHRNILLGKPEKMKIIARRDSYHGMTMAATTLTGQDMIRDRIGPLMPGVLHVDQPAEQGIVSAEQLEETILREGPETIAAFLGEPVAVPPGLAVPPDDYWSSIRDVCDRYDIDLIADEVINGFGRTGHMFGCDNWDLKPDLMVMSKGITSGYQPLGAVGFREEMFEVLLQSETLLPLGFTVGGHPVCSAVARKNIEILQRDGLIDNSQEIGKYLRQRLDEMAAADDRIVGVRSVGMLAAFDVDTGDSVTPAAGGFSGGRLGDIIKEKGLLIRPYGNTMVMAPPLICTRSDVDEMVDRIVAGLAEL